MITLLDYPIPGSVEEAIKKLRENNIKAFVFDLHVNRFLPVEFMVDFHLMLLKNLNLYMVVLMQWSAFS